MELKAKVVDRVPLYPGRVKLTPVSGQANTYDMVRADQPTQEGTPINKALFDKKADTLTAAATVYVSTGGNDTTGDGTAAAPYRTVNKALSTIPKNLGGFNAVVNVEAGEYEEFVTVNDFLGSITFGGTTGTVVFRGLSVTRAQLALNINLVVSASGATAITLARNAILLANEAVRISGADIGVYAQTGSAATFNIGLGVSNCTSAAVRVAAAARVHVEALEGSENAIGVFVHSGGVLSYGTNALTATIGTRAATGGRILSGSQASIPNY